MIKVTTESFIEKAKKIHGEKYDYSKVKYVYSNLNVKIFCRIHGEFNQQPNNHLQGKGCPKCAGNVILTTEQFIQKAKNVHGDKYDYSIAIYIDSKTPVKIICALHGEFEQSPDSHTRITIGCGKCAGNKQLTTESFIQKAKNVHGDKYDYSRVFYTVGKKKIEIVCPIHGYFEQTANKHLSGDGCSQCASNKRLNLDEFIKRAKRNHSDRYDYSKVNYTNNSNKVIIICPKHGDFNQKPNNHINGNGCPKCKESQGERAIRKILVENNIKFEGQYRFDNCRHTLPLPFDFYLPDLNTCIEFQGRQHYVAIPKWGGEEALKSIKIRDKIKREYCKVNNIPLIIIRFNGNIPNKLKSLLHVKPQRMES